MKIIMLAAIILIILISYSSIVLPVIKIVSKNILGQKTLTSHYKIQLKSFTLGNFLIKTLARLKANIKTTNL